MLKRRTNLRSPVRHIAHTAAAASNRSPAHFPCRPRVSERHPALGTSVLVFAYAYAELRRGLMDLAVFGYRERRVSLRGDFPPDRFPVSISTPDPVARTPSHVEYGCLTDPTARHKV